MKIAIVGPVYLKHMEQIYAKYLDLDKETYSKQYSIICREAYGSITEWPSVLKEKGFSVEEYIYNLSPLQHKWALENGFNFNEEAWEKEILEEQLKRNQPDIVLIYNAPYFANGYLSHIRELCPSIKKVITWYGSPMGDETIFNDYDLVFSNSYDLCDSLNKLGVPTAFIPHAFSEKVFAHIDRNIERDIYFSFCGTINKTQIEHLERTELIELLVKKTNLQVWSDIPRLNRNEKYKTFFLSMAYDYFDSIREYPLLFKISKALPVFGKWEHMEIRPDSTGFHPSSFYRNVNRPVFGLEMFKTLARSQMTLNGHIQHTGINSVNMRLFEATGMGCCLLVDRRNILKNYFEEDKEILTYTSKEEAVEKVRYIQRHPGKMKEMGIAAQKRTLSEHTVENQISMLLTALKMKLIL